MKNFTLIIAFVFLTNFKVFGSNSTASISGYIPNSSNGDSVKLMTNKYGYLYAVPIDGFKVYTSKIVNHRFHFVIPISTTHLFSELHFISKVQKPALTGFFIEKGDEVNMTETNAGYLFSGTGSNKYKVWFNLYEMSNSFFKKTAILRAKHNELKEIYIINDSIGSSELIFLESQQAKISKEAYTLLKANILGFIYETVPTIFYHLSGLPDSITNALRSSIIKYKRKLPKDYLPDSNFNKRQILGSAGSYSTGIIMTYQLDSCYLLKKPFIVSKCYKYLITNYSGTLRERAILYLLYRYRDNGQDITSSILDSYKYISEPEFLAIIRRLEKAKTENSIAYNFSLIDEVGKIHRLDDYRGKIVLLDFWFTGCGNCIRVAPYLKKLEEKFYGKEVVFLSINYDNSKKTWLNSLLGHKYTSQYSVNLSTAPLGISHPACKNFEINDAPTLILIGKDGKLMRSPIDPRNDDGENLRHLIEEKL